MNFLNHVWPTRTMEERASAPQPEDDDKLSAVSQAEKLRRLLSRPGILSFPCCYDALSARLIERAGFPLTFMSGFGVAAVLLRARARGHGVQARGPPLALLGPSILSMKRALAALKEGRAPEETISFEELKEDAGFPEYYREEERYGRDGE